MATFIQSTSSDQKLTVSGKTQAEKTWKTKGGEKLEVFIVISTQSGGWPGRPLFVYANDMTRDILYNTIDYTLTPSIQKARIVMIIDISN